MVNIIHVEHHQIILEVDQEVQEVEQQVNLDQPHQEGQGIVLQ